MSSAFLLASLWALVTVTGTGADQLPTCQPNDFHYEYTECDSEGGRWRVSVPKPATCVGGAPNPPVRGKSCNFQCEPGYFLDVQGDQECHKCSAGTFSLGGAIRFEDFNTLPNGFSVKTESFSASGISAGEKEENANCTNSGWVPRGGYVAAIADSCVATMKFTTNLVKAGKLTFEYQYEDENSILHVVVENNECLSYGDEGTNKWPPMTGEGKWQLFRVDLTSGLNVINWRTIGIRTNGHQFKATKIRNVEITGVAYSSECTKCRNGTSSKEGASECTPCPKNTFSARGADKCTNCDLKTQYSDEGASQCLPRPPCTEHDYFEYSTPCDANKKTQKLYKWVQPQICRTDLKGAKKLPQAKQKVACPPCNPGMYRKANKCEFCPKNHFSDGTVCKACPVSTAPKYGLAYQWWNEQNPNITTSCESGDDRGCATKEGWQVAGDHISSGKGHADDSYLILSLKIGGFGGTESVINGKPSEVARLSFVFEMDCDQTKGPSECQLYLGMESEDKYLAIINTWVGKVEKQPFSFPITKTGPVTFTWTFQKVGWSEAYLNGSIQRKHSDDVVKIYSINVTNTLDGGAGSCEACPIGMKGNNCIPCPDGHYIDGNSTTCKECPPNTVLASNRAYGVESCIPCGPGLKSHDHKSCYSDCSFTDVEGHEYDFSKLKGFQSVDGAQLFTSSGTHYFHNFNISLCGMDIGLAECNNNITVGKGKDLPNVKAQVCRHTIIPPAIAKSGSTIMSAQPVSLGENLISVSENGTLLEQQMKTEGFETEDMEMCVHFKYTSESTTGACPKGRSTIISLHCDTSEKGRGTIQLPPKCPDGTCDGCNFHFLWRTPHACPVCKNQDYDVVKGECVNGKQIIHYYPPKHCVLLSGSKPSKKVVKCPMLPLYAEIAIVTAAFSGVLLFCMVVYCWKRNRSLEYKYMKLVANSDSKCGELPAAETCGMDEDEEDQFDAVQFKESKGKKLLNKLKRIAGKGEDDNPFESIQLTDKGDFSDI